MVGLQQVLAQIGPPAKSVSETRRALARAAIFVEAAGCRHGRSCSASLATVSGAWLREEK